MEAGEGLVRNEVRVITKLRPAETVTKQLCEAAQDPKLFHAVMAYSAITNLIAGDPEDRKRHQDKTVREALENDRFARVAEYLATLTPEETLAICFQIA